MKKLWVRVYEFANSAYVFERKPNWWDLPWSPLYGSRTPAEWIVGEISEMDWRYLKRFGNMQRFRASDKMPTIVCDWDKLEPLLENS